MSVLLSGFYLSAINCIVTSYPALCIINYWRHFPDSTRAMSNWRRTWWMGRIFPFSLKAGSLELSMETLIEDTPLINSWSFGMQECIKNYEKGEGMCIFGLLAYFYLSNYLSFLEQREKSWHPWSPFLFKWYSFTDSCISCENEDVDSLLNKPFRHGWV